MVKSVTSCSEGEGEVLDFCKGGAYWRVVREAIQLTDDLSMLSVKSFPLGGSQGCQRETVETSRCGNSIVHPKSK